MKKCYLDLFGWKAGKPSAPSARWVWSTGMKAHHWLSACGSFRKLGKAYEWNLGIFTFLGFLGHDVLETPIIIIMSNVIAAHQAQRYGLTCKRHRALSSALVRISSANFHRKIGTFLEGQVSRHGRRIGHVLRMLLPSHAFSNILHA